jgi:hypothetical protein
LSLEKKPRRDCEKKLGLEKSWAWKKAGPGKKLGLEKKPRRDGEKKLREPELLWGFKKPTSNSAFFSLFSQLSLGFFSRPSFFQTQILFQARLFFQAQPFPDLKPVELPLHYQ